MSSTTTILTRHDVTVEGYDLSASMMLDDAGAGHIMVSTPAGASFSMDAGTAPGMMRLLAECEDLREAIIRAHTFTHTI